jgi:hypothetical protein
MEVITKTITIARFSIDASHDYSALLVGHVKEEHTEGNHLPISYWGIFLDDKYVSYTSNRELTKKTKTWVEKWLKGDFGI